ncbi:Ger(x)C family germination protein [Tumebacillus sp. BK434]|uniref:Ger(x)C family spore germination protein n=1 Tax=Tumebacillus sp. BK434 TaxID=2512169 RepID=UPI001051D435|nr:Ger(x)C family spore germination protein [Tumebacillus sp. BK434]TCP59132.1 Ger(x)C family germination protein [Tumebacillus sp. BK434]
MTRKWILVTLTTALLVCGCGLEGKSLEEMSISLVVAIDDEEKNGLTMYQSYPVFSQTGQGKSRILKATAESVRDASGQMQSMSPGTIRSGKLQVLLIGKQFLERRAAGPYIDSIQRDAKNPTNVIVAVVDGAVDKVMQYNPKERTLGPYLHELIDTAYKQGSTVETLLHECYNRSYEPGMTLALTEMEYLGNTARIKGTALLNKMGRYAGSLDREESMLLMLMQDELEREVAYTLDGKGLSMNLAPVRHKVRTGWSQGAFQFEMKLKLNAEITEVSAESYHEQNIKAVEKMIATELQKEFQKLITKLQRLEVDPLGLGLYARAYQFKHWREAEKNWPAAFAKAKIHVTTDVTIENYGVIK